MKIGIFGDSYATTFRGPDKPAWVELLEDHGHTVNSFAKGGTSILWSAKLLEEFASEYDFLIWCYSCSPRVTLPINEPPGVLNTRWDLDSYDNESFNLEETRQKIDCLKKWFRYGYDPRELKIIGESLVDYYLKKYDNLMIIPCFDEPINAEFCMSQICMMEIEHCFPDIKDYYTFFKKYREERSCHMSTENNQIFANLVAKNLQPGIFQTELSNFKKPGSWDKLFTKI
jgi:hypothetical protein